MTKSAESIAAEINASGRTVYGDKAKPWSCESHSRIYFGRDYVTIEANGEIHARKNGKASAKTAGASAVELVEEFSATC